jgi:hypothetical protein
MGRIIKPIKRQEPSLQEPQDTNNPIQRIGDPLGVGVNLPIKKPLPHRSPSMLRPIRRFEDGGILDEDLTSDETMQQDQGMVQDGQSNIPSSTTPDMTILDEIRQLKKQSQEQYDKASNTDIWLKLAEGINKGMSMRDQSKALNAVKSPGMQAMGTDLKLDTDTAKNILDRRKSDIENLLSEYKLKQSLKPAGPKTMKVGDRLVSVDPTTGTVKELYKPGLTPEELKQQKEDRGLAKLKTEAEIKKLQKDVEDLTPEQKEAAIVNLLSAKEDLKKKQLQNEQDPERSQMEKIKQAADIQRLMTENEIALENLKKMKTTKEPTELEKAKIGDLEATTSLKKAQADQLNKKPSSNIFQEKKMEKLAASAAEYITKDRGQLVSNVGKIDVALGLMDKAPSGDVSGPFRGLAPDKIRSYSNPEAIIVKESMQSAIQETLRPTLGAQFTEKEGERIMNLAYNDKLSPEENKRRATDLKKFIQKKVEFSDALYSHVGKNGSDEGFPYEKYGMNKQGSGADQGAQQDTRIDQFYEKNKSKFKNKEEAKQYLTSKGII